MDDNGRFSPSGALRAILAGKLADADECSNAHFLQVMVNPNFQTSVDIVVEFAVSSRSEIFGESLKIEEKDGNCEKGDKDMVGIPQMAARRCLPCLIFDLISNRSTIHTVSDWEKER